MARGIAVTERLEHRPERVVRDRRCGRVVHGAIGVAEAELWESRVAPEPRQRVIARGVARRERDRSVQILKGAVVDARQRVFVCGRTQRLRRGSERGSGGRGGKPGSGAFKRRGRHASGPRFSRQRPYLPHEHFEGIRRRTFRGFPLRRRRGDLARALSRWSSGTRRGRCAAGGAADTLGTRCVPHPAITSDRATHAMTRTTRLPDRINWSRSSGDRSAARRPRRPSAACGPACRARKASAPPTAGRDR